MIIRMALAALTLLLVGAPAQAQNWNNEVVQTERGYRVGNPEAPIQLIAFESYTCPVCKDFEIESEAEMRLVYIHEGRAAVEIRPVIRSNIDLAAALLAECGADNMFLGNHLAFYHTQDEWLEKARRTSAEQRRRWNSGYLAQQMRAIAGDLDFYELMETRGYSWSEADRCLGDEARAVQISNNAAMNGAEFAIPGTPSFAINGTLVPGAYTWETLRPALESVSQ